MTTEEDAPIHKPKLLTENYLTAKTRDEDHGGMTNSSTPYRTASIIVYPIKSIRGISLPDATLTPQGLLHDRRYLLLRPKDDGSWAKMFVGNQPEMALFHCELPPPSASSSSSPKTFTVRYR
ncbi:hypothetical protein IFR05_016921, partial [Cadophora sp. M221]